MTSLFHSRIHLRRFLFCNALRRPLILDFFCLSFAIWAVGRNSDFVVAFGTLVLLHEMHTTQRYVISDPHSESSNATSVSIQD